MIGEIILEELTCKQYSHWHYKSFLLPCSFAEITGSLFPLYNYLAHMNLGIDLSDKRKFGEAIDQYNQVIRIKPDYVDAYNNRGYNYLIQGNKNLGCPDAQKACSMGLCIALKYAEGRGYCR